MLVRRIDDAAVRACGVAIVAIGAAVLFGWWQGLTLLKSISASFASMKPTAAVGFIAAGLALLALRWQALPRGRPLALALDGFVVLLGAATLAQYWFDLDLGVDRLLFSAQMGGPGSLAGRMAPMTAVCFCTLGTALALTLHGRRAGLAVAQGLTISSLLVCLASMVGYLYGAEELYGLPGQPHIAPHTLVCLALLGTAILALSPDYGLARLLGQESAGGLLLRRLLPACVAVPIFLGTFRLWGEEAGLYDTRLGLTLFATSLVAVMAWLVVRAARAVTAQQDRRLAAEEALRQANEALEARVGERTEALARAVSELEQRVAERTRAETSLRRSEQRYRALTRSLPNGAMILYDGELRCLIADGAALPAAFGLPREEIEGRTLLQVASPETREQLVALARATLGGQSSSREVLRGERVLALEFAPVTAEDGRVEAGMVLMYDVTDRARAEAAVIRSAQQFRRLVEVIPEMVLVARDQRFEYGNPAALRALGYDSVEQLVGTPVQAIVLDSPEDMRRQVAAVSAGETFLHPIEGRRRRRDGSEFVAEAVSMPLEFEGRPAMVTIGRDVTRQRRAEAVVREATARWRAILDSAAYSIIATTPEGVIREFNVAAERMLGYAASEVVGKVTPAIIHEPAEVVARALALSRELGEEVPVGFETLVAKARRGGSDENEWTYIRKDGSRFPVRLSVTAMRDGSGVISGFLGIASDITEHRRAREELVRAKDAAEQAMRARSDFLARMSHEIRTPMNGVLGMTALALELPLGDEARDYIETARASARSLLALINDVLDFSKIDAGKLRLERARFRTRELFRQSLRSLASQARAKGVELLVELAPDLPAGLIGDPQRLQQVTTNLVANAVKFTDRGQVEVRVASLATGPAMVTLEVTVTDTGIGIAPQQQASIFEAFSQADEGTTRRFGGTGLGLAICKQLVELMGGRLWLDSELGRGSRFGFSVPLALDPEGPEDRSLPASLAGVPVLVVDAHREQAEIVARLLASWHMRPVIGKPPRAGELVREARAHGHAFQLLIVDEGADAEEPRLEAALREAGGDRVPILTLTGGAEIAPRGSGPAATLSKPVDASGLLETVQALLVDASLPGPGAGAGRALAARPLRVLVAEDNAVNRKLAVRLLERAGHSVVTADNGRLALTALARQPFDLVLMDVQMPGMDGLEATRVLRASEAATGAHLPVIALTAQAMKGDREACLAAGMDAYVSKPLDLDELFAAIEQVTRSAGAVRAEAPPPAGSPDAAPAFDRQELADRVGDDPGFLDELVAMFRAELPRMVRALTEAAQARDQAGLNQAAHALKGSLLNLGARPAAAIARDLEQRGREGNLDGVLDEVSALSRELERLDRALPPPSA